MPRAQLTFEQRLAKYKISQDRFDNESSALRDVGFTSDQADMLIIRQSSSNTVKSVLTNYRTLLVQPYELNHQQIIIIASHGGGSKNIEAVQAAFQPLTVLGFNADQVVKIAGKIGGSKNIEAVQAAFQALTGLGFNADQVVKIAGHGGGSKNIEAVQKHHQDLLAKGYSKEALVSMMARNSGSRKIYGIVAKNAAEDAASNFLHFVNTVLASSETSLSENSLSAPSSTSTFFSPPAMNKRPKPADDHADEEAAAAADKHRDKRPNQGR